MKNVAKRIWFRIARWGCGVFCAVFFRLRVKGVENVPEKGAFVLVSNHQCFFDPLFCWVPLKKHLYFLARDTLFAHWFARLWISSLDTIAVKRGEADLRAIRLGLTKLREGDVVCVFPEGTRTHDGRIRPFKSGFSLLCKRGGAAVVPVVIDGAFEAWPRHKKYFTRGAEITACYGKSIPAEHVKDMGNDELAETLTNTLRRMQHECRERSGKEPYEY